MQRTAMFDKINVVLTLQNAEVLNALAHSLMNVPNEVNIINLRLEVEELESKKMKLKDEINDLKRENARFLRFKSSLCKDCRVKVANFEGR